MSTSLTLVKDSLLSITFHVAPRFANVLLFILLGRLSGPAEAGIFTLATTYLLIFTTIMRGIDDLTVRQVSREPDKAINYLTSFLLLRLGLSFILYGILWFVSVVIFDYSDSTTYPIIILGLSLIPDSLTYVAQSVLIGKRLFKIPAIVFTGVSLFKLILGVIILLIGGGLVQIAWVWLVGSLLGTCVMLPLVVKSIGGIREFNKFSRIPKISHRRVIFTFMFLTILATFETQSDTILLSIFYSEVEIGWYGAATTIVYSLLMISQAYRFATYPLMSRYALHDSKKLAQLYELSIHYLLLLVLPIIAGINLLSFQFIPLIFGSEFSPTIDVVNILVFTLFFLFINEPNIRVMLVYDQQGKVVLFLLISVGVNILINLLLIPPLGATGSAIARVSSTFSLFIFSYIYVAHFYVSVNLLNLLSKPLVATIVMILVVFPIRTWPLFISICVGGATYLLVLGAIGGISSRELDLLR